MILVEIGSDVHLSDVAGDLGASGSARDEPNVALLVDDDGRDHGREGSLAWDWKVIGRRRDAEAVGDAGKGEVVHLVVQYYARRRGQDLGAKAGEKNKDLDGFVLVGIFTCSESDRFSGWVLYQGCFDVNMAQ